MEGGGRRRRSLGRIKFLVPGLLAGSRKSRPDRADENPGGSGRAGQTSGAQRNGELQHATRAEGRHQLRQRLHVLAGVRH